MYFRNLIVIMSIIMITRTQAEMWKFPTAGDIQTSLETCQITNRGFLDLNENYSDIRCFTRELGLWNDDEGFREKRFVKLLSKHRQPIEIAVVIDYCNNVHKQIDLGKWASEAFKCFARGRMGSWINEYFQDAYKKKITN